MPNQCRVLSGINILAEAEALPTLNANYRALNATQRRWHLNVDRKYC